jgi:hypothetical protein
MRTTADAAAKAAVIQHFELFGVLQVFLPTGAVLLLSVLRNEKKHRPHETTERDPQSTHTGVYIQGTG